MNLQLLLVCFVACFANLSYCADPYASIKIELSACMSADAIEELIRSDEAARRSLKPMPEAKIMTDEERNFRAEMVQRAHAAKFGNTGGK